MPDAIQPREDDALLVVDIQNDFCPGGALEVPEGGRIVPVVNELCARFDQVVLTQDWHPRGHRSFASSHAGKEPFSTVNLDYGEQILWPDHCVQDTEGAAFHPDLDTRPAQMIVRKGFRSQIDSYSAFYENDRRTPTGLAGYLRERGVERVVIVGLAFDFCVRWGPPDAVACGFEAVVIEDATRGIDVDGSVADTRRRLQEIGVPMARSGLSQRAA